MRREKRLPRKECMETAIRACKFLFEEKRTVGSREKSAGRKCVEKCCLIVNICIANLIFQSTSSMLSR